MSRFILFRRGKRGWRRIDEVDLPRFIDAYNYFRLKYGVKKPRRKRIIVLLHDKYRYAIYDEASKEVTIPKYLHLMAFKIRLRIEDLKDLHTLWLQLKKVIDDG